MGTTRPAGAATSTRTGTPARGFRAATAALLGGVLLLTAATGCSSGSGSGGDSGRAEDRRPAPASTAPQRPLSYQPYVSATTAHPTDGAGEPEVFNLAFVVADHGECAPVWGGTRKVDDPEVRARAAGLTAGGAGVRVSFGGAAGDELATACASPAALASAYAAALDAVDAGRADFDVEGDELGDAASVDLRSRAIARLQRERPDLEVTFTLPVMPSGLDDDALAVLESAGRHGVEVATVNLMTMNYAETYDGDMGAYAEAAAQSAHAQLRRALGLSAADAWRHMALTSMIGVNDVEGETFTVADAAQVRRFAQDKGIAWVSMWAAFRDRPCADDERDGDSAPAYCSGVDQRPGAFARAFSGTPAD